MIETAVSVYLILKGFCVHSDSQKGAIGIRDGVIAKRISQVYAGTPAQDVGLKIGDRIVRVLSDDGSAEITGPAGTYVDIWVMRGKEEFHFKIRRAPETSIHRKVDKVSKDSQEPDTCQPSLSPYSLSPDAM